MVRRSTDPRRAAFFIAEIWRSVRLAWRLSIDPRVSLGSKLIVPAALLYLIFPVDLVPDLLLGLGQLDDLALLYFGFKLFIEMCPPAVVQEHLAALALGRKSRQGNKGSSSKSAAPTIEGVYRVVDDRK